MDPRLTFGLAQAHQQELHRQAEAARLAAEARTHGRLRDRRITSPRTPIRRRFAAIRATIAHA